MGELFSRGHENMAMLKLAPQGYEMTRELIFPGEESDLSSQWTLGKLSQGWPKRPQIKPKPHRKLSLGLAETDHEKCPIFSSTTTGQPPDSAYHSDLALCLGGCSGPGLEETGIFSNHVCRL